MRDAEEIVFAAIAGFVLFFVLGAVAGCPSGQEMERTRMQREAIERGFAEHDPKTGEWRWVETTKEESK